MNWLLILVVLFIAAMCVWGYHEGFLRVGYSLVSWILVLVLVIWLTPYVSETIKTLTPLESQIEEKCITYMQEHVQQKTEETLEETDEVRHEQELENLGIAIPAVLADKLFHSGEVADTILEETGVYQSVAEKMSDLAIKGIAFLITLVIASLLSLLISFGLKIIDKIPIINGCNRFIGLFAGAIKGVLIIWVGFCIIALTSTTKVSQVLIGYIYEAPILTALYENNLIITIITILF